MKVQNLSLLAAGSALLALLSTAMVFASTPDATWIKTAASANMLEIKAGDLAAMRATSPQWKHFGEMMARDHTKALGQIRSLASDKGVDLRSSLMPGDQRAYAMLHRRRGASFDEAYEKFAVASHVQANQLYNHEIDHGRDSDVRAVAAKQLPTVQNHLTMADEMAGASKSNLSQGTGK